MLNGQTLGTADSNQRSGNNSSRSRTRSPQQNEKYSIYKSTRSSCRSKPTGVASTHIACTKQKSLNAFQFPRLRKSKNCIDQQGAQLEGTDPATANQQAAAYLQAESESKLADDLVNRLRKTIPVVMGADINSPNLNNEAVVATIGGQPLKAGVLNERLKPIVYQIRLDAYEITRQQAEQLSATCCSWKKHDAARLDQKRSSELRSAIKFARQLKQTWQSFYEENKVRINGDLNGVRNQIASYLQERERQRLEEDLSARLRKNANIRWLITEPPPPVQNISVDDDPSRGPANAPVTIVEFTDFQCPACAAMHPVIEEVLKSYGDKVRFVVETFP